MALDASQVQLAAKIATVGRDGVDVVILDLADSALFGAALKVFHEQYAAYVTEYGVGMIQELREVFDGVLTQLKLAAKEATNGKSAGAAADTLERVQTTLGTLIPDEGTRH